jgi:septum formation topological specificity factor MinE
MRTCESLKEAITLHASGDLPVEEVQVVEEHLASCPACRAGHQATLATLRALSPATVFPEESAVDWDRFAAETSERARSADRAGRVLPLRRPRMALFRPERLARAAAVILAVGLGYLLLQELGPEPVAPPADRQDRRAGVAELGPPGSVMVLPEDFQRRLEYNLAREHTRQYLEESREVLLSVFDSTVRCTKDEVDIAAERQKSIELIRRKRLLRDRLDRPELARAAELCDRLEGILTEISTLRNCADVERIRELRDAVRRNQLLVKIGVAQEELGGTRA